MLRYQIGLVIKGIRSSFPQLDYVVARFGNHKDDSQPWTITLPAAFHKRESCWVLFALYILVHLFPEKWKNKSQINSKTFSSTSPKSAVFANLYACIESHRRIDPKQLTKMYAEYSGPLQKVGIKCTPRYKRLPFLCGAEQIALIGQSVLEKKSKWLIESNFRRTGESTFRVSQSTYLGSNDVFVCESSLFKSRATIISKKSGHKSVKISTNDFRSISLARDNPDTTDRDDLFTLLWFFANKCPCKIDNHQQMLFRTAIETSISSESPKGGTDYTPSRIHYSAFLLKALERRDLATIGRILDIQDLEIPPPLLAEAAILINNHVAWRNACNSHGDEMLFWKGRGLYLSGHYESGINHLIRALDNSQDNYMRANIARNIGNAIADCGQIDLASKILHAVVNLSETLQTNALLRIKALTDIIRVNIKKGDVLTAQATKKRAVALAQQCNNPWREQIITLNYHDMLIEHLIENPHLKDTFPVSLINQERLIAINNDLENPVGRIKHKYTSGLLALYCNDHGSAVALLEEALSQVTYFPFAFYTGYRIASLADKFLDLSHSESQKRISYYVDAMTDERSKIGHLISMHPAFLHKWHQPLSGPEINRSNDNNQNPL